MPNFVFHNLGTYLHIHNCVNCLLWLGSWCRDGRRITNMGGGKNGPIKKGRMVLVMRKTGEDVDKVARALSGINPPGS